MVRVIPGLPWRAIGVLFLAVVLDDKIAPHVRIPSLLPDFTRVAVCWIALSVGGRGVVWCAFAAGLLLDAAVPEGLGARALSLCVVAYAVWRVSGEIDWLRSFTQVVVVTGAGIIDASIYRLARHVSDPLAGLTAFVTHDVPALVPSALLTLAVLLVVRRRRAIRGRAIPLRGASA